MRKLLALLVSAGLLVGCAATSEESDSPASPSAEIAEEIQEDSPDSQDSGDSESGVTEPMTDEEESQPTQPTESEFGGVLLRAAEEDGLLNCFELLGPDFTRSANGVESIVWYCLPEQNVRSLQVVVATYESVELMDAALTDWERNFASLAEQFRWENLTYETTWVGILSKPDEWDDSLPSSLMEIWGWSGATSSESDDAAIDSIANKFDIEAALENVSNLLESAQDSGIVECTGNTFAAEAMDVGFGQEVFTSCQTDFGMLVINEYPSDSHAAAASDNYIDVVAGLDYSERINLAVMNDERTYIYVWGEALAQLDVPALANHLGFDYEQILTGLLE